MPILAQHQITITKNCPFHPDRDYLWWPFLKKYENTEEEDDDDDDDDGSFWVCPFCGLDFYCPESLTLHWDEQHRDSISKNYVSKNLCAKESNIVCLFWQRDDLVCLADYCDIFRCDVLMRKRLQRKKQRFLGYLTFGQDAEAFKECDPVQMVHLQQSCLNVIRQCTASVEYNTSSLEMANIEKKLAESVCSYLTCDHYNDDLFAEDNAVSDNCLHSRSKSNQPLIKLPLFMLQSRKVPIILFSTIGVILVGGFCFCYYLIWTLFEYDIGILLPGLIFTCLQARPTEAKRTTSRN